MARFRLRPLPWIVGGTGHATVTGSLQVRTAKELGSVLLGGSGRTVIGGGLSYSVPPPVGDTWTVPNLNFDQGSGQTYDLDQTVPASFTDGGIFDVDSTGNPTPSGMTLSDTGVLGVGSATVTTASNVKFGYTEPNALPVLTLHPTQTAILPYMATVYPCEGAVPSGRFLVSPNDPNLRSVTLSSWPDGSAQVMVVASNGIQVDAGFQKTVNLRLNKATDVAGTALTTSAIASKFTTGIYVDFGVGSTATLNSWASPDRVWWANSQVICARYRLAIPNKGVMEAVVDVHAFAGGRAFVEVVIENSRMDSTNPVTPATQTYTNATVSVNGTVINGAGTSSPTAGQVYQRPGGSGTYAGGHEAFRAWYCSGWVGNDPMVTVTHDAASLQKHPIFWGQMIASTENFQTTYSNATYDVYAPWKPCRLRVPSMAAGGGSEEIAPYTRAQSGYIITGDKYAATAVVNHTLGALCASINYRDSTSNLVPSVADVNGRCGSNGNWPVTDYSYPGWTSTEPYFDRAHQPAHGLVAFLCRPSPVFLEIAQKIMCWNFVYAQGVPHTYSQLRARAWTTRNYMHGLFVTPDNLPDRTGTAGAWKTAGRVAVNAERVDVDLFLNQPWNTLGAMWEYEGNPNSFYDWKDQSEGTGRAGYQTSFFQQNYIGICFDMVSRAKVLRGSEQTSFDTTADRLLGFQVRWINDALSYEWRGLPYQPTIGVKVGETSIDMSPHNLVTLTRQEMSGTPYNTPGPWKRLDVDLYNYDTLPTDVGGNSYSGFFVSALACAVERDVAGASTAWDRMFAGIDNWTSWKNGSLQEPTYNRWPRNVT